MAERSHRVRRIFGWILGVILALSLAIGLALQLPPVRAFIRDKAMAAAASSVNGTLALDDLRWPSPDYLELSGLELKDRHGTRVAAFSTLMATLRLRSLFAGQVELKRLDITDLYVDLADLGDEHGLLSVFASEPKQPEPPKPPNAALSPVTIVLRELCIDRGQLHMQMGDDQVFTLRRLDTCVRVRVGDSLQLAVEKLTAEVFRNADFVAQLTAADQLPEAGKDSKAQSLRANLAAKLKFQSADDMAFDATVRARGFSPKTLEALGIADKTLRNAVDLDAHVVQTGGRMRYRALVTSAAGALVAHGDMDPQRNVKLRVETAAFSLAELTTLEFPTLGFAIDARVALGSDDKMPLELDLPYGYYDKWAMPSLSLVGERQADGTLILRRLDAQQDRAVVSGNAKYQSNGAAAAHLDVTVPDLAEIPPLAASDPSLHGALELHLDATRAPDEQIDAKVELTVQELVGQAARAGSLHVNATVAGKLESPVARVELHGTDLLLAQRPVHRADLLLTGGPSRYVFELEADREALRVDGWADYERPGWTLGMTASARLPQGVVSAQLPQAYFVPGESLELSQLRAYLDKNSFLVDGKLDLQGNDNRLRLAGSVPDVQRLTQLFGAQPVPGRAELIGTLRGQLDRPVAEIKLRYMHGPSIGGHPVELTVTGNADAPHGNLRLQLMARAGRAQAVTQLNSRWPERLPLSAVADVAQHDLRLQFHDFSIPTLMDPTNPTPLRPVDGMVDGTVDVHGNLKKFRFETHVESRVTAARDPASVDVSFDTKYENARLDVSAEVGDRRGQLLTMKSDADVNLERQIAKPQPLMVWLNAARWELESELFERSVHELPMAKSFGADEELIPIHAALHANVVHEPNVDPVVKAETKLSWRPLQALRKIATTCSDRTQGSVEIKARWEDRQVALEMRGTTSGVASKLQENLRFAAHMPLAFSQVLAGAPLDLSALKVALQLHKLDLKRLPWVCEQGAGNISLTAKAEAPLTKQANVLLQVDTEGLSWEQSPPFALQLEARSEAQAMKLTGQLTAADGVMHLAGQLPVDVHVGDTTRMVRRSDPMQLDMQLQKVPMASLLAFAPGVARVSGSSSGTIQVRGSVNAPDARGDLSLEDVSLTLPRMGQRFAHVYLKAKLDGQTLRLSDGKVRDLTGSATLAALLVVRAANSWRAELNLNARNFPIRKSGVIMGSADADTEIVADMTPERGKVDVSLKNVAIELSSEGMGDVQPLEPHPDFAFADARSSAEKLVPKTEEPPGPPINIHIGTTDTLWVRRDDFAVQMVVDISVMLADGKPLMKGKIDLVRGYISLLGTTFDIKRGQVVLAGSENIDPQLEINAEHSTPGGKRVQLAVSGFVTKPELAFQVDGRAASAGEAILAINSRGGGGSTAPEMQVANAAIGMTTGLLSLGARREFGDWIPMLQIESGNQTRVRVGIEADRFIPKFMKGFVRGAYVEGIFSSAGTTNNNNSGATSSGGSGSAGSSNTASGSGVLLELMLPKDFVWAGQYGPGQAWSIDLDWRP